MMGRVPGSNSNQPRSSFENTRNSPEVLDEDYHHSLQINAVIDVAAITGASVRE